MSEAKATCVNNPRRTNGFTLPPHPYQVIVWLVIVFVQLIYIGSVAPSLPSSLTVFAYLFNIIIFIIHLISHVRCALINPADENVLRIWNPDIEVKAPSFDRTKHSHVIEDQFCHICNSFVGKNTKHCSRCNKCISDFDHHCKWLNTCVGGRNYISFLVCITSALIGCLLIAVLSTISSAMYYLNPTWLSPFSTNYNTSHQSATLTFLFGSVNDTAWLSVVFITAAITGISSIMLGHLLSYHIYLVYKGLSTYQMIVKQREIKSRESHQDNNLGFHKQIGEYTKKLHCKGAPKNQVSPALRHGQITPTHDIRTSNPLHMQNEQASRSPLTFKSKQSPTQQKVAIRYSDNVAEIIRTDDEDKSIHIAHDSAVILPLTNQFTKAAKNDEVCETNYTKNENMKHCEEIPLASYKTSDIIQDKEQNVEKESTFPNNVFSNCAWADDERESSPEPENKKNQHIDSDLDAEFTKGDVHSLKQTNHKWAFKINPTEETEFYENNKTVAESIPWSSQVTMDVDGIITVMHKQSNNADNERVSQDQSKRFFMLDSNYPDNLNNV